MYTLKSEVLKLAPMKCTVGDCTSGAILTPEEVLRFQHHRSANQVLIQPVNLNTDFEKSTSKTGNPYSILLGRGPDPVRRLEIEFRFSNRGAILFCFLPKPRVLNPNLFFPTWSACTLKVKRRPSWISRSPHRMGIVCRRKSYDTCFLCLFRSLNSFLILISNSKHAMHVSWCTLIEERKEMVTGDA